MQIEDQYINTNADCALGKNNSLHIGLLYHVETN